MTSPSSYLFPVRNKPNPEGNEHDQQAHVLISDNKVALSITEVRRHAESGVLREEILIEQRFYLRRNAHGDKYIQKSEKRATILDHSFSRVNEFLGLPFPLNLQASTLIEDAVLSWFEGEYSRNSLPPHVDHLYYPVFRDPKLASNFPVTSGMLSILERVPRASVITKALRENNSWGTFIDDICDPNVIKTQVDTDLVKRHPTELIPLAMMNLGQPVSSLYVEFNEMLLQINYSFTAMDLKFIAFMFKYLPVSNHGEAVRLLLDVTRSFQERTIYSDRDNPNRTAHLNRVPYKLRSKLAQELFKRLKFTHEGLQNATKSYITETTIDTHFCDVFNSWFYSNVMEPAIANAQTDAVSLEARFTELFGTILRKTSGRKGSSSIRFFSKDGITAFAAISEAYAHGTTDDIFTSLDRLVVTNRPKSRGSGCDAISNEGYTDEYDNWNWIFGEIYFLDDIMVIIEKGASIIDRHLTKLGRDLTPENRAFFLVFNSGEGKLKSTWKYFDWGVIDPKRILALKKGGIAKKANVQIYNELPDEMFYELLALEAGLPTLTGQQRG